MKYLILLFIFAATPVLFASANISSSDKKIMDYAFNFEFDKAEKLLAQNFKDNPENLKNHYLYINTEILKVIQATDAQPFRNKKAVKDSLHHILINYAEKVVEKYEDKKLSTDDKYYLGSIYGFLGRMHGVEGSWMPAFSNGKAGKNMLEDIIEKDAQYADAYLLLGIINYYADRLGGVVGFVAGVLGLSGDREVGIQYLKLAEQKGKLTSSQAAMLLVELYSRLEDNNLTALPYFEKLIKRHPKNSHFINWYCRELMELNELDKVTELIKNDSLNLIVPDVKARYYSLTGEYEKSNKLLNELLKTEGTLFPFMEEHYKFVRVLNYFMLGNINEANKYKKNLEPEQKKYIDYFILSPEPAKKLIKFREFIGFSKNKNEIEAFIKNPGDIGKSNYLKGYFNFCTAVYYFQNGKIKEAESYFLKAKEAHPEGFLHSTAPYLIYIYKNTKVSDEKVENLLDDIDDFDNDGLSFSAEDLKIKYDL
ncbi:MAG: hypothetical protein A2068_10330 [Ignavibacteria bacterium GWB2_35_6b]|nr:MAG: hypothetical protein A2068_10330 [Ignavibacteria bacterium GWB2_35_6b]